MPQRRISVARFPDCAALQPGYDGIRFGGPEPHSPGPAPLRRQTESAPQVSGQGPRTAGLSS
ncbi:MAG TPA: hypothetical protein VJ577_01665, partial [Burkholderiaceae bacterium]|nr:hypothetical protein [Burkholderiaceae bacterium]